ncbi:uncharacterized protein MEPE_06346 [Melanopsichium pennsylvanicum]|uniref:Uncharacterized protein n=1 Tax=Melanopsichium pennsylvanicum TaxID=63383 RepID=A0AAJ4XTF6_9BASI|nr:uncharacterized protein MEPE_06346 [Melanopsichium pennsylvanicum]
MQSAETSSTRSSVGHNLLLQRRGGMTSLQWSIAAKPHQPSLSHRLSSDVLGKQIQAHTIKKENSNLAHPEQALKQSPHVRSSRRTDVVRPPRIEHFPLSGNRRQRASLCMPTSKVPFLLPADSGAQRMVHDRRHIPHNPTRGSLLHLDTLSECNTSPHDTSEMSLDQPSMSMHKLKPPSLGLASSVGCTSFQVTEDTLQNNRILQESKCERIVLAGLCRICGNGQF